MNIDWFNRKKIQALEETLVASCETVISEMKQVVAMELEAQIDALLREKVATAQELEGTLDVAIKALAAERVDKGNRADELDKLKAELVSIKNLHTDRIRICSVSLDPEGLTSQIRAIHPGLRVEWDGHKAVVYSNERLKQSQVNAVVEKMQPRVNMT